MKVITKIVYLTAAEYDAQMDSVTSTIDRFNTLIKKQAVPILFSQGTPEIRIQTLTSGTDAQRPTLTASDRGVSYFNTTSGIPEYWSGSAWVGASVVATEGVSGLVKKSAAVANVTLADATDLPTAIALLNELKAKFNAKMMADRLAGQQTT